MGFAELIEQLNELPAEKQAEVIDFAHFVAQKYRNMNMEKTLGESSLAEFFVNGIVPGFQPMSREEANAR
jgi:hypothetical protein